jgi:uncharacterized protein with FMN-binding domain
MTIKKDKTTINSYENSFFINFLIFITIKAGKITKIKLLERIPNTLNLPVEYILP